MFEQITLERGHCTLCHAYGLAISLPLGGHPQLDAPLMCERCLRAGVKAADVLKTLRVARAPKAKATPKKPRRRATGQPSAIQTHRDGPEHGEGSSLASVADASS